MLQATVRIDVALVHAAHASAVARARIGFLADFGNLSDHVPVHITVPLEEAEAGAGAAL